MEILSVFKCIVSISFLSIIPANLRGDTEIAFEIAKQPSNILRLAKRLFNLSQGRNLEEVLELSAAYQALCHHTPEHEKVVEKLISSQKKPTKM